MANPKKSLKYIWLARHGESRGNTGEERDIDPPLSEQGQQQAARLSESLGHITFDRIYVSPLKRTRQTLEMSGLAMNDVVFDSRIIEWRPEGAYEPYLPYETLPDYGKPDAHSAWRLPFNDRINAFADEVRLQEFDHVLVVTHGGASIGLADAFVTGTHDPPPVHLHYMTNTGVALLRLSADGKECRLAIWNHTGHLGSLASVCQAPL